jgi:hypothetical protein
MKKFNLYVLVLVSLFFSCQSDEAENEKITPTLKLEFTYDGVLYSSAYHYSSDSIVIVDDEKVGEVYNKLMENEQLATVVGEDGKIIYYDDFESIENALLQPLNTKSINFSSSLSLYLYEHIGYAGAVFNYNGSSLIEIPDLYNPCKICLPASLNDQVTSIIANFSYIRDSYTPITSIPSGVSLTIFEHDIVTRHKGKSLTFQSGFSSTNETGGSGQIKINTLIDYKMKSGGLFHSDTSWNDQMSSATFTFYNK